MNYKIVIDNVAFSIQKIGGISVVWYEIIKRLLLDKQYNDCYLEYPNNNYYRNLLSIPQEKIIQKRGFLFSIKRYINAFLKIKEPFIFHSTYYRYAKNSNAINITTIHDFTYEKIRNKKNLSYLIHKNQKRRAVEHSDFVVCISENTKQDALEFYKGIDENKLVVIYNGVSEEYKQLNKDAVNELPFPFQTYCLFVGLRRKYKNYHLAISSIKETNLNLLLIGPPLTEEEKSFLNVELGEDRYTCLSHVINERLNELYNGAFCLLYLSLYEGFGIPCLEAQKAGCPVIAYNSSSIPEVVCNKDLLVNSLDVESVLTVLNKLSDKDYRNRIVNEGIIFAQRFSWDKTYKELSALYERAIKERLKNKIYETSSSYQPKC